MGEQPGTIVWQRHYDEAGHDERMRRFWTYCAVPPALLIPVVGLVSGVDPAAGLLILLGLFGSMPFLWFWLVGRNEPTYRTITQDAGDLCWG